MFQNKDKDTIVICIYFMQNRPLPYLTVQEVFYMRQPWLNVFCNHDMKTNTAQMYIYHEGEANKSPDEVFKRDQLHFKISSAGKEDTSYIVLRNIFTQRC